MIPKIIHYCWYGSKEIPLKYSRCIDSWNKYLADYKIIRWDETNTNIDTPFLKDAISRKNWAFLSDYIRMRATFELGGIYLDADTEIIKNLDPLLNNSCFLGYESKNRPTTGIMGSTERHPFPSACMKIIDERFAKRLPYLISPEITILALAAIDTHDIKIYDQKFFYPFNPYDGERPSTGLMFSDITEETYSIHHWAKGWNDNKKDTAIRRLFNLLKCRLQF